MNGIMQVLKKSGKDFMSMAAFKRQAPSELKKNIGFKSTTNGAALAEILKPYLGDDLETVKKGAIFYIAEKKSPAEFVMRHISASTKAVAPKALGRALPLLTKAEIIAALNSLIHDGKIAVLIDDKYETKLNAEEKDKVITAKKKFEINPTSKPHTADIFKKAFDELDNGKIFVRICDLRQKLDWAREEFDAILRRLRDDEQIQLHSGDATTMTEDESKDCFVDENGFRMGTVTWNGK